jgi:hypothetical protein
MFLPLTKVIEIITIISPRILKTAVHIHKKFQTAEFLERRKLKNIARCGYFLRFLLVYSKKSINTILLTLLQMGGNSAVNCKNI